MRCIGFINVSVFFVIDNDFCVLFDGVLDEVIYFVYCSFGN